MAANPPTQQDYEAEYLVLATSLNPQIDVSQFTDFQIKGAVLGGIVAGAALDSYNRYIDTVPQTASIQGVNIMLASRGVPITLPSTQASVTFKVVNTNITPTPATGATVTFRIPIGTTLNSSNGNTYTIISANNITGSVTVDNAANNTFSAISVAFGTGTAPSTSNVTFTPPILDITGVYSLNAAFVQSSVDGTDGESQADATNRLVEILRTPLAGTRATDWKNIILTNTPNPLSTTKDVVVLSNNQLNYSSGNYNVGLYLLAGASTVTDTLLNQGLLPSTNEVEYSREVNAAEVTNAQTIARGYDVIGVFPNVQTVHTRLLIQNPTTTPFFQIMVQLQATYTLGTNISLFDPVSQNTYQLTLEKLIQREVRRAICNQPLGADLDITPQTFAYQTSRFPISSIEQQIDLALGNNGIYGNIIKSRSVMIWNGSQYTYQPFIIFQDTGIPDDPTKNLKWVYDLTTAGIIYSNIFVGVFS